MRTLLFLMLFATVCLAQQTGAPATNSVENIRAFVRISDSLGTSGQPKPEQFSTIKDAGYRVVINLAPSDVNGAVKEEQQIVEGLGLKYIYIPVVWAEPKVEDAEKFFAAMKANKDQKVFVHCIANMRVSAFTYLYRTTQLGVSEEDARKDLQKIWTPSGTWQQFINTVKAQQPSGSGASGSVKKSFINPDGVAKSPYYTHAVAVEGGKTIHISGQVALNAEGQLVGKGDLRTQTAQAFENLKLALQAAGATFSDVVKINTYVVNLKPEGVAAIREVRTKYLPATNPPASTLVGVQALFREDVLIEIEAVAVIK